MSPGQRDDALPSTQVERFAGYIESAYPCLNKLLEREIEVRIAGNWQVLNFYAKPSRGCSVLVDRGLQSGATFRVGEKTDPRDARQ